MKKLHFIFFLSILFCSTAYSQFSIGPKGSFQLYKTSYFEEETKDSIATKFKGGYSLGFFINAPLKNKYSVTFEAAYTRRGRKNLLDSDKITHISKYNFIEMPLLLRRDFDAYFVENVKSTWFIEIGPNISYWLGGSGSIEDVAQPVDYKIVFGSKTGTTTDEIMYIENENRFLFGLEFGAGFNIHTQGRESLTCELRYTHGHTFLGEPNSPTLNNDILGFTDNLKANYRVISLSLAYSFNVDLSILKKGKSVSGKVKKGGKRRK